MHTRKSLQLIVNKIKLGPAYGFDFIYNMLVNCGRFSRFVGRAVLCVCTSVIICLDLLFNASSSSSFLARPMEFDAFASPACFDRPAFLAERVRWLPFPARSALFSSLSRRRVRVFGVFVGPIRQLAVRPICGCVCCVQHFEIDRVENAQFRMHIIFGMLVCACVRFVSPVAQREANANYVCCLMTS